MRSQGTPTVGDLKREIEALKTQGEDRDARIEELEERAGLSDGGNEDEWVERVVKDEIRRDMERRNRRRMQDRGQLACLDSQEEENAETGKEYEDPSPSFVGERTDRDDDEILAELGLHEGEFVVASGGIEIFRDRNGDYRLTTEAIRAGMSAEIQIAHPTRLRELADQIERAEQDAVRERVPRETVDEYHYYEGEL